MYQIILIRYGEISLKGRNRSRFEDILISNITHALKDLDYKRISKAYGRIYIECHSGWEAIGLRLGGYSELFPCRPH